MTGPGYARDPNGRVSCMRISDSGARRGWCGVRHLFDDTAMTHARSLNRQRIGFSDLGTYSRTDHWIVVPATVADGTRP